jgi:hypothetical protein
MGKRQRSSPLCGRFAAKKWIQKSILDTKKMYASSAAAIPIPLHELAAISGGKASSSTMSDYGNACLAGGGAVAFAAAFTTGPVGIALGGLAGCAGGMLLQAIR